MDRRWFWFLGKDGGEGWVQYGLGLATVQWMESVGWLWWWNKD